MKTSILTFVAGATIGSFVTWRYIKVKYERIAEEEIESVKEVFSRRDSASGESTTRGLRAGSGASDEPMSRSNMKQERPASERVDYTRYSAKKQVVVDKEKEEDDNMSKPYIISPEDFGENDYTKVGLKIFSDNVLVDDNDEKLDSTNDIVSLDVANHFGEYEDDSVFVRDDRLKVDYEILLDLRSYSDVANIKPHQMED